MFFFFFFLPDMIKMPSVKTVVATAASMAASAMVVRSIASELVPYELRCYFFTSIQSFLQSFSSETVLIIEDSDGLDRNQIYEAAEIYLGSKVSPSTQMFTLNKSEKETRISTSAVQNQEIVDIFHGAKLKWRQVKRELDHCRILRADENSVVATSEIRYFELRFHKKHKQVVMDSYLPFVLESSKNLKEERKKLKIYSSGTSNIGWWNCTDLDHPATFDTLVMDSEVKKMIMEDLQRFVRRKELYRRVGKAWKRGYLLYGPPGTGKSSLVAAMANFLNFDIYNLELTTALHDKSDLKRLLIATENRSILLVEDIDRHLDLRDHQVEVEEHQSNQVTLIGLVKLIDGLWCSYGDERIIVFTTNHIDRVGPALLRPGRMDVHIPMAYCNTPCGFRTLAKNYTGLSSHSLFPEIEDLLGKTMVTPSEVGEQLLRSKEPETALQGLIDFLLEKLRETEGK